MRDVRATVSPQFAVAVKLNSADFQRGGFSADDAKRVVELLNPLGVDLVELSGGSYEVPAMQGEARDGRTLAREAYFLEFARDITAVARMPLMVTGGIRRRVVAEQVVDSGVAMVGIATALSIEPNLPRDWRAGGQRAGAGTDPLEEQGAGRAGQHGGRQVPAHAAERWPAHAPAGVAAARAGRQQLAAQCQTRRYRKWMAGARRARVRDAVMRPGEGFVGPPLCADPGVHAVA